MKMSFFRGGLVALFAVALMTIGFVGFAEAQKGPCESNKKCKGDPADIATIGDMKLDSKIATSLKGRVYAHWMEKFFSVFNTGIPRALVKREIRWVAPLTIVTWRFLIRCLHAAPGGLLVEKTKIIPMPGGTILKRPFAFG